MVSRLSTVALVLLISGCAREPQPSYWVRCYDMEPYAPRIDYNINDYPVAR